MKLICLFGQRKESYDGEYTPELLVAWDEYTHDENPKGWEEDVKMQHDIHDGAMSSYRIVYVEVDQDKIRSLLVSAPLVPGKVSDVPQ